MENINECVSLLTSELIPFYFLPSNQTGSVPSSRFVFGLSSYRLAPGSIQCVWIEK